jgi:N-acyl homoserine lactone hydrolase
LTCSGTEASRFVDLAGHSDGTTGVLIQNGGRFVMLTADACYNRQNWEQLRLQGITTDREKALRALEWVRMMSREPGCAGILATHDPEIKPHTIEL